VTRRSQKQLAGRRHSLDSKVPVHDFDVVVLPTQESGTSSRFQAPDESSRVSNDTTREADGVVYIDIGPGLTGAGQLHPGACSGTGADPKTLVCRDGEHSQVATHHGSALQSDKGAVSPAHGLFVSRHDRCAPPTTRLGARLAHSRALSRRLGVPTSVHHDRPYDHQSAHCSCELHGRGFPRKLRGHGGRSSRKEVDRASEQRQREQGCERSAPLHDGFAQRGAVVAGKEVTGRAECELTPLVAGRQRDQDGTAPGSGRLAGVEDHQIFDSQAGPGPRKSHGDAPRSRLLLLSERRSVDSHDLVADDGLTFSIRQTTQGLLYRRSLFLPDDLVLRLCDLPNVDQTVQMAAMSICVAPERSNEVPSGDDCIGGESVTAYAKPYGENGGESFLNDIVDGVRVTQARSRDPSNDPVELGNNIVQGLFCFGLAQDSITSHCSPARLFL
jgi:hypothetical protein